MDWTNLVIQLPIVAAFIWYSLEQQKRFQDSIDKREVRYQESMDKRDEAYLRALDKISCSVDVHDQRVMETLLSQKVGPTRRKNVNNG